MKKVAITLMAALCLIWQSWQANAQNLVNPNASKEAKGLKSYLDDVYGKQMLSGQYWKTWADYIKTNTGKNPAILGLDFMDYTQRRRQEGAKPTDTEQAIDWTNNQNGIVTFSWHWDAPTDIYDAAFRQECAGTTGGDARWYKAFYSCAVYFDLNDALNNPGGTKYNLLIRDIDVVAAELKKLRDAGVPVLWRPLHEASGGWFWWGAKGPGPCKRLWALMYDRLTNYHKLNNLIWVWNCYGTQYGNAMDWFPGYNMVDIIAYDYPRSTSWSEYNSIHGGKGKQFALAEVSSLPDPNNFNNAKWGYFVTWGDFIKNSNSVDYIRRVYNDPKTITLENLPDWKNYANANDNNIAFQKPVKVSSTEATFGNVASNINDGSASTRWSSAYADPQWVQIDLGSRKAISKVTLVWEAASAKTYNLEVSDDAITWTVVKASTNMAAGPRTDTHSNLTAKGRYVRMYGTERNTTYGYSIYEFRAEGTDAPSGPIANAGADQTKNDADNNGNESITLNGSATTLEAGTTATYVWRENGVQLATGVSPSVVLSVGSHTITLTVTDNNGASTSDQVVINVSEYQAPNIALKKPVTVSSTEATLGNIAVNANDGSTTTRWSSAYADPQWIQIDLQANYQITKVVLNWEAASAKDYKVETSLDGTTWNSLSNKTAMAAGARIDNLSNLSGIGRYLRITGTSRNTIYGYSLFEVEAYGTLAGTVNFPPTANAGADVTVTDQDNNLSELVTLTGVGSDADGTVASFSWKEATNASLTATTASASFTLPIGSYRFILTVTDNEGASSSDEVLVTVKAKETCTLLSLFGVPTSTSLPSISNRTFSKVFVIGNGPNLNNVTSAVIQWERQYNGLWQFAFNTNNGVPQWYLNLIPLTSQTFASANPACKLTGTGIAKLDGDYWVKMDGVNFVMVAKTGSHALYFTNSTTAPVGCSNVRFATTEVSEELDAATVVAPTLVSNSQEVSISIPQELGNVEISILNTNGEIIKSFNADSNAAIVIDNQFKSGLHLIRISNGTQTITRKIVVQ